MLATKQSCETTKGSQQNQMAKQWDRDLSF